VLLGATFLTETATRVTSASHALHHEVKDIFKLGVMVIAELAAQHATTTIVALLALRWKGWHPRSTKSELVDGRQKHFE
jgi:hypothetical protein